MAVTVIVWVPMTIVSLPMIWRMVAARASGPPRARSSSSRMAWPASR